MFLRCIFAHVCGRDYSLQLIMLVSCFHKQSLVGKKKILTSQSEKLADATLFLHNVLKLINSLYIQQLSKLAIVWTELCVILS